jgi:hypothetical protein
MFAAYHPHISTPSFPYPLQRTEEDPLNEFNKIYEPVAALRGLTQRKVKLKEGPTLNAWATLNYLSNPLFRERVPHFSPELVPKGELTIYNGDSAFKIEIDLSSLPANTLLSFITPEMLDRGATTRSFGNYLYDLHALRRSQEANKLQ